MPKVKIKTEKLQKLLDGDETPDTIELDANDVSFTDNYVLEAKGKVKDVGKRVQGAYKNAIENLLEGNLDGEHDYDGLVEDFDDFRRKFAERQDLIEPSEDPSDEWKQSHLDPLKNKLNNKEQRLEELQSTVQTLNERTKRNEIIQAAHQQGVSTEQMGDPDKWVQQWLSDFDVVDGQTVWKNTEDPDIDYRYSDENGTQFAGPKEYFSSLKEDERYQGMFGKPRNKESGFRQAGTNGKRNSSSSAANSYTRSELKKIAGRDIDKYNRIMEEYDKGNVEFIDNE